ncbi:unnamed protein product, partial [Cuscuta epithymum]
MEIGPHSEERTNAFLALSPETRLYSNLKKEFRGMAIYSPSISPIRVGLRRSVRNISKSPSSFQDASVVSIDSTDNGEDDTTSVTDDVFTLPAVIECASSMHNAPNLNLKSAAGTSSSSGVRKALDPTELLHLKSKKRRLMPPLPPATPSTAATTCSLPVVAPSLKDGAQETTLKAGFSANF